MFKKLSSIFIYTSIATMLLVVLPGFPPYIPFKSFKLSPSQNMTGKLAPRFVLDNATPVKAEVLGGESLTIQGNIMYTGVAGGDIIKIEESKDGARVSTIGRTGEPCEPNNVRCGRPLGIRLDKKGNLVIADAYEGIVAINPKTGARQIYFPIQDPIEGTVPKFPDDLDVSRDGSVYWSDLSTTMSLHEFTLANMDDNTGRLIKYDPKTKTNTVLMSGLFAINGVQLSEKEDFILVNEFTKARVLRYYLKGPKQGTFDVFVNGLPGHPDNIRPNGKGGYMIALFERSPAIENLGPLPQLRKLLFRLQWFVLTGLSIVERTRLFDNNRMEQLKWEVQNFGKLGLLGSSSLLEVDGNGNILAWYKTKTDKIFGMTQATVGKSHVYLSSIMDDKLWKISLEELRR